MSTALTVRRALPIDTAAIRAIHLAAAKGPDSLERNNTNVLRWLDSRVADDYLQDMQHEQFVVAELDGQLAGFGAISLAKAQISSVYVMPAETRKGIASALVRAMEAIAVDARLTTLQLQAAGGALRFYEKQGYVYVGERSKAGPLWAGMRKSLP